MRCLLYAVEEFTKFVGGYGAVADFVFQFVAHFGECLRVAFGYEYRVVTETGSSASGLYDFSFHDAFKEVLFSVDD